MLALLAVLKRRQYRLKQAERRWRTKFYLLDEEGTIVQTRNPVVWGEWLETATNRVVAQDKLPRKAMVSTVFLGLDHNHSGIGPPVLWETIVFGGPFADFQARYRSREGAVEGHNRALAINLMFDLVPRRTKKALAKRNANLTWREERRVKRALERAMASTALVRRTA